MASGVDFTHPPAGRGYFRWTICALLFLATTINYMDRQVLGILASALQTRFGWNEVQYGHIVTAFQGAYAAGMLLFGRLVDLIGTKRGYALAMGLWSLAAMGHALARSAFGFGLARFALGFGEAGNFPAAVKAVAEWFPKRERALATGLFNAGSNIGAVVTPAVVPWLTLNYGWQMAFVAVGAVGFGWMALWGALYHPPKFSPHISSEELAYIHSDRPEPAVAKIAWSRLLRHRQTWAFIVGIAASAPIWWFYLYWLPKFLNQEHGLDLASLGSPLILVYTMTCVGSIGGGWLSSHWLRRGWSINGARKTAMLACALCVVPVTFAPGAHNVWLATGLIGLATAAHAGWAANLFTMVSDMFPKQAVASVVGLGGLFSSGTAMLFSESVGFILQTTGSYWSLFLIAGLAYLLALAVMHALTPRMLPVQLL